MAWGMLAAAPSEVVEYRIEQHWAKLEDRLARLAGDHLGTTVDTAPAGLVVSD
jgi:hypothetical protein